MWTYSLDGCVRHLKGQAGGGGSSVYQGSRHLNGHPGWCPSRSVDLALKGAPWVGSFTGDGCVRHLKGHPYGVLLDRLAGQALKGAPCEGSYSVDMRVSLLRKHPGWGGGYLL